MLSGAAVSLSCLSVCLCLSMAAVLLLRHSLRPCLSTHLCVSVCASLWRLFCCFAPPAALLGLKVDVQSSLRLAWLSSPRHILAHPFPLFVLSNPPVPFSLSQSPTARIHQHHHNDATPGYRQTCWASGSVRQRAASGNCGAWRYDMAQKGGKTERSAVHTALRPVLLVLVPSLLLRRHAQSLGE